MLLQREEDHRAPDYKHRQINWFIGRVDAVDLKPAVTKSISPDITGSFRLNKGRNSGLGN